MVQNFEQELLKRFKGPRRVVSLSVDEECRSAVDTASNPALDVFSHSLLDDAQGQSRPSALVAGYHVTFLIGAFLAAMGLVVTLVVLRAPAKEVIEAQSSPVEEADQERSVVFAGEF